MSDEPVSIVALESEATRISKLVDAQTSDRFELIDRLDAVKSEIDHILYCLGQRRSEAVSFGLHGGSQETETMFVISEAMKWAENRLCDVEEVRRIADYVHSRWGSA